MNAIPLKRIEGCLVAKEALIKEYENEIAVEKLSGNVVKEAMAKGIVMGLKMNPQGEVQVTLNRDNLAKRICDSRYGEGSFIRWKQITSSYATSLIEISYEDADAILSALPELVEVVNE